jgi:hypothetical protein
MPAITVEGDQILRGGRPWWLLGYNSFVWSGDCGHDDEKMSPQQVEDWFAGMRHDGHGAVRLFFYDGWDLDRLDHARADRPREQHLPHHHPRRRHRRLRENDKTAEWFADQSERDVYRTTWRCSCSATRASTTFAWFEFFNEPDYEDGALREFFDEMGAAADRIDPDRLFSSGTVAPYWVDGEDNFADIHEITRRRHRQPPRVRRDEIESNHGPRVRATARQTRHRRRVRHQGCEDDFDSRAERFAKQGRGLHRHGIGYVGAFAWPGSRRGGGCELGNLDVDEATQEVLREHRLDEDAAAGAPPAPTTPVPTTTTVPRPPGPRPRPGPHDHAGPHDDDAAPTTTTPPPPPRAPWSPRRRPGAHHVAGPLPSPGDRADEVRRAAQARRSAPSRPRSRRPRTRWRPCSTCSPPQPPAPGV